MPVYLSGPAGNPFTRLLAGVVGVLALAGAAFFGLFLFAAVIAVGLVAWAVIGLRLWWLQRRLRSAGARAENRFAEAAEHTGREDRSVIDADYEVVSRDQDER